MVRPGLAAGNGETVSQLLTRGPTFDTLYTHFLSSVTNPWYTISLVSVCPFSYGNKIVWLCNCKDPTRLLAAVRTPVSYPDDCSFESWTRRLLSGVWNRSWFFLITWSVVQGLKRLAENRTTRILFLAVTWNNGFGAEKYGWFSSAVNQSHPFSVDGRNASLIIYAVRHESSFCINKYLFCNYVC